MAWSSLAPSGNFSPPNTSLPWLPSNTDFTTKNVQRQSECVQRLIKLIQFRKQYFRSSTVEKHGNYLFHYIHGGELVLERYFNVDQSKRGNNGNNQQGGDTSGDDGGGTSGSRQRTNQAKINEFNLNSKMETSSNIQRARYVLFANLGTELKVKDLRDKFHLGTILVTSQSKRMRDFLYFKSLRLDAGEAIIAQVE